MENLITLFTNPQVAISGIFCAIVVPSLYVMVGKKYKKYVLALAVVGFVWFVISIIMNWSS